jgi:hypothetical protein
MTIQASGTIQKDKDFYTEQEAASLLGISLARVHLLLDKNVFNDGSSRPNNIHLTPSDVLLLQFWNRVLPRQKIVAMPKRHN